MLMHWLCCMPYCTCTSKLTQHNYSLYNSKEDVLVLIFIISATECLSICMHVCVYVCITQARGFICMHGMLNILPKSEGVSHSDQYAMCLSQYLKHPQTRVIFTIPTIQSYASCNICCSD